MFIVGLDFETTYHTPVDPTIARVTEIGAVLWDTVMKAPILMFSSLVYAENYPEIPPEGVALNGISTDLLQKYGVLPSIAFGNLNSLLNKCDYVVAHNGTGFDKPVYENELPRVGKGMVVKPWVDTCLDVPYPDHIKTRKLTYLAAEHGFANPFSHRALFDVMTMLRIMHEYTMDEIIELSKQPTVEVIASVTFQNKDLAKARGYLWDGERKKWVKRMKQSFAAKEVAQAPFHVNVY